MSKLTPDEAKAIAQVYFKECLKRLHWQLETADKFSSSVIKILNTEDRLKSYKNGDFTSDAFRIDFLIPDNFKYENPDNPQEVTGMILGYHNHFDGDQGKIVRHLLSRNNREDEEGTLSYKAMEKAVAKTVGSVSV